MMLATRYRIGHGTLGFTLSELLISLAILGVIATFSIPKIMIALENNQKKAIVKETVAMLQAIQHEGMQSNQLRPDNFIDYFMSRMQAAKVCPSNSVTQGCWDLSSQPNLGYAKSYKAGVILPNGAAVVGFENCCDNGHDTWHNQIVIDWNGSRPPNVQGEDFMYVTFCYNSKGWCGPWSYAGWQGIWAANHPAGPGILGPGSDTDALLYDVALK